MKSEIVSKHSEKAEKPFPKLMKSNLTGAVVLFLGKDTGVCVLPSGADVEIEYSTGWLTESFIDFDGVIQLSND